MEKKKCVVCKKVKPIVEFAFQGQAIRCNDCKKKADAKPKKPGKDHFGLI